MKELACEIASAYEQPYCIKASVAGTVERINKLITVRAAKMRYNGEVGDIIVGRVIEVRIIILIIILLITIM